METVAGSYLDHLVDREQAKQNPLVGQHRTMLVVRRRPAWEASAWKKVLHF